MIKNTSVDNSILLIVCYRSGLKSLSLDVQPWHCWWWQHGCLVWTEVRSEETGESPQSPPPTTESGPVTGNILVNPRYTLRSLSVSDYTDYQLQIWPCLHSSALCLGSFIKHAILSGLLQRHPHWDLIYPWHLSFYLSDIHGMTWRQGLTMWYWIDIDRLTWTPIALWRGHLAKTI